MLQETPCNHFCGAATSQIIAVLTMCRSFLKARGLQFADTAANVARMKKKNRKHS
jgi:hypothetical protein